MILIDRINTDDFEYRFKCITKYTSDDIKISMRIEENDISKEIIVEPLFINGILIVDFNFDELKENQSVVIELKNNVDNELLGRYKLIYTTRDVQEMVITEKVNNKMKL